MPPPPAKSKPIIVTIKENPKKTFTFDSVEKFLLEWTEARRFDRYGTPVLNGVTIKDFKFQNSDDFEDEDDYDMDGAPRLNLSVVLNNCKLENLDFGEDVNLSIEAHDTTIKDLRIHWSDVVLSGEKIKLSGLDTSEAQVKLDLKDSELTELDAYKTRFSGSMVGGRFEFSQGRTWLGSRAPLVMEGVDFGKEDYDPDYFNQDYLTLIAPKMKPSVLEELKALKPSAVLDKAPSKADRSARIKEASDKAKADLLGMGVKFFESTGKKGAAGVKAAEAIYERLAARGEVTHDNFSTELMNTLMGGRG